MGKHLLIAITVNSLVILRLFDLKMPSTNLNNLGAYLIQKKCITKPPFFTLRVIWRHEHSLQPPLNKNKFLFTSLPFQMVLSSAWSRLCSRDILFTTPGPVYYPPPIASQDATPYGCFPSWLMTPSDLSQLPAVHSDGSAKYLVLLVLDYLEFQSALNRTRHAHIYSKTFAVFFHNTQLCLTLDKFRLQLVMPAQISFQWNQKMLGLQVGPEPRSPDYIQVRRFGRLVCCQKSFIFKPSATVSRISALWSHVCVVVVGDPPPSGWLTPPGWLPPQSCTWRCGQPYRVMSESAWRTPPLAGWPPPGWTPWLADPPLAGYPPTWWMVDALCTDKAYLFNVLGWCH